MSRCQIFKTSKEYIIVTSSETEDWIWVADEPIFRVPVENADSRLIEPVLNALKSSRVDIPNIPMEAKAAWQKEILKKMGQPSFARLYEISNSCSVRRDTNGKVEVSPYKPFTPGKLSSGLTVAKEDVVLLDMKFSSVSDLESTLIEILNRDYKR